MPRADVDATDELIRRGKHAEAIERLRTLLSEDPENAELRARAGEAYRLAGNKDRAFHHFHRAATIALRRGDTALSLKMLRAANGVGPNQPEILFRLGECLKVSGPPSELEAVLRQLVGVAAGVGDRRRLWALEELAAMRPEDLDVAIRLAMALGEARKVEEALAAWRRLVPRLDHHGIDPSPMLAQLAALVPDRVDVGVAAAGVLLACRRAREALTLIIPYYEKAPDSVELLEVLIPALESLGALDKVLPARMELVKARTRLGQRQQALAEAAQLLPLAPGEPAVMELAAHTFTAFNAPGEAARLYLQLARAHEARGQRADRDRALLALLKVNPNHEEGLEYAIQVLRRGGKPDEAVALERRLAGLRRASGEGSAPGTPAPITGAPRSTGIPGGVTPAPRPESGTPTPTPTIRRDPATQPPAAPTPPVAAGVVRAEPSSPGRRPRSETLWGDDRRPPPPAVAPAPLGSEGPTAGGVAVPARPTTGDAGAEPRAPSRAQGSEPPRPVGGLPPPASRARAPIIAASDEDDGALFRPSAAPQSRSRIRDPFFDEVVAGAAPASPRRPHTDEATTPGARRRAPSSLADLFEESTFIDDEQTGSDEPRTDRGASALDPDAL